MTGAMAVTMTPDGGFEKWFEAAWSDVDPYQHLRNSAYSDYASHTRFSYFAERGYPFSRFTELGVAPIIFKETLEYLKEIRLLQRFVINFRLAGLAPDGSRWRIFHEFFREDGAAGDSAELVRSATITMDGAWLELARRRVAPPPSGMVVLFGDLPHTADFEELPPIRRRD